MGFQPASTLKIESNGLVTCGPGIPFGIAFMGTAWSEAQLLAYAYAFEQETRNTGRLGRRAYDAACPKTQLVDVM